MDELKIKLIPRKPVKKVMKKQCDHEKRILSCEVEVQSKEREFLQARDSLTKAVKSKENELNKIISQIKSI